MDVKLLSPVKETKDLSELHPGDLTDSKHPKRRLKRNSSESDILDKDVPIIEQQGKIIIFLDTRINLHAPFYF